MGKSLSCLLGERNPWLRPDLIYLSQWWLRERVTKQGVFQGGWEKWRRLSSLRDRRLGRVAADRDEVTE